MIFMINPPLPIGKGGLIMCPLTFWWFLCYNIFGRLGIAFDNLTNKSLDEFHAILELRVRGF